MATGTSCLYSGYIMIGSIIQSERSARSCLHACVAFITHVYETVYLIQQRESDMFAMERSERAKTQAELEALKAQIALHFLLIAQRRELVPLG